MQKPSVLLLGSKPGAVAALSVLLERGWNVKGVVTSLKYNYSWLPSPTLDVFAADNNIPVMTTQAMVDLPEKVDFVISYMFRYRVKPEILALARRGAMNFHPAPLPEFGGWAFYNMAILEDSPEYGCTCHYMDDGFDTGPLFKVRRFPIDASRETAWSLERKTQKEMIDLFWEFCEAAESSENLPIEPQDASKMRYLTHEEFDALKQIDPSSDAETIQRQARAFWYPPYLCAYLKVGAATIEVVPEIVKEELASIIHRDDHEALASPVPLANRAEG